MKICLFLLTCFFPCLIKAQQPLNDPHPLIGILNGEVYKMTVVTRLIDPYNPAKTDTLTYTLNSSNDTAKLVINGSLTNYELHIYDKKKQLVKQIVCYPGNQYETAFTPRKHKPSEINLEKKQLPEYTRTDTTKKYYDKANRLIKMIETNNITKSRFTTIYQYDLLGNIAEERQYTYNADIKSMEALTKHMRVNYTYDEKKNWITKHLSYLSVTDEKPYQEIISGREIIYR
jgi:hypothetical protein